MSELNQLESNYSVDSKYMRNRRMTSGFSKMYTDERFAYGRGFEGFKVASGFNENPVKNYKKKEKNN